MMKWTKESALKQLEISIQEIEKVRDAGRHSAEHTRWALNTVSVLSEVFGRDSKYYLTFTGLRWSETSGFVIQSSNIQGAIDHRNELAFKRDLDIARGTLHAAYEHLERSEMDAVYEGKNTAPDSSAIVQVINIVEHKLRRVIRSAPVYEKEVQDTMLLRARSTPYRSTSISTKNSLT